MQSGFGDYYGVLGVPRTATTQEIKKAYRKIALELHPDKLGREVTEEDEQRFIRIVLAYEVLSDADKRQRYDIHGPETGAGGPGRGRGGGNQYRAKSYHLFPFDMYVHLPSGAFEFHYTPPGTPNAEDVGVELELTLEEVYTGVTRTVLVTRQRYCDQCHGRGSVEPGLNGTKPCEVCEATGRHLYVAAHEHGYKHVINTTCEHCHGTGEVVVTPCPKCGGGRIVVDTSPQNVTVPPGTPHGQSLPYPGQGNQRLHHTDGKLVYWVVHRPHPRFRTDEEGNLLYTATIPLIDALVGFERNLTLLDGSKLRVVHDIVTFSGYEQSYEGYGMPDPAQPGQHKDLILQFRVTFPRRLSEEQRAILRDLMDEEELAILEDVIQLAAAREAERSGTLMSDVEARQSSVCDPHDPFMCVADTVAEIVYAASLPPQLRARAGHGGPSDPANASATG